MGSLVARPFFSAAGVSDGSFSMWFPLPWPSRTFGAAGIRTSVGRNSENGALHAKQSALQQVEVHASDVLKRPVQLLWAHPALPKMGSLVARPFFSAAGVSDGSFSMWFPLPWPSRTFGAAGIRTSVGRNSENGALHAKQSALQQVEVHIYIYMHLFYTPPFCGFQPLVFGECLSYIGERNNWLSLVFQIFPSVRTSQVWKATKLSQAILLVGRP